MLKVQEKSWDVTDAITGQVIHKDEKFGGYSHIASTSGMLFFVKADKKKLYMLKLPIASGATQVKHPLEQEPIVFTPSNTDDKD